MNWILLLIIIGLTLGPIGHLAQSWPLTPNLFTVFLWGVSWFGLRSQSIALAIAGGLLLDLVGWSWFGLWTFSALMIVLAVNTLKERKLDTSSIIHALLALAVVSLIAPILLSAMTGRINIRDIVLSIIGNVVLGILVYYILAMRLRMFQQWAGRRIR